MSRSELLRLLQFALEDTTFRRRLFNDPGSATRSYTLTVSEKRLLTGLDDERFAELVRSLVKDAKGLPGDEGFGDGPIDEFDEDQEEEEVEEEADEDGLAGEEGWGDGPID